MISGNEGIHNQHMENDFINLGFRHGSILLVYTYGCTSIDLFANKYV